MNQKLLEAVAIAKELGWENATQENVLSLPLGTPEQKRKALDGLSSGEWGGFAETEENTYSYRSYCGMDEKSLALFAVRIGVSAQRASNILRAFGNEIIVKAIASRGTKYASDFIGYACVSRRRAWEHSASAFGSVAVYLVDRLRLDIPQNVEYMKDWSAYAAAAMGLKAELRQRNETDLPGSDLIEKRFAEHIKTGIAVNAPATGPFGSVLPAGVKRGWLPREKAVEQVFTALDASVRPGDRKSWLGVLDDLDITDQELCSHIHSLIPLMATGDNAVVTRLAPVLVNGADDNLLTETLIAAFSATTKKARILVLKSALDRPCPKNVKSLAPWLSLLAGEKDKSVASLAARLMKQWKICADVFPEETTEIQGLWQATPPVWVAPAFELGDVSSAALTGLAARLVNQPSVVHDATAERFLSVANALAHQNPEAARASLRGLRPGDDFLLYSMVCWVKGENPKYGFDTDKKGGVEHPLRARDYVVCLDLDKLPCLLSTPSMVDLTVTVPDLTSRLALYRETGTDALEADLFLAMTRLDVETKTPESVRALQKLDVPILLQSGKRLPATAGQAVLRYLDDPVKETAMDVNNYGWWCRADIAMPDSLCGFPDRLGAYLQELFSLFPLWGDVALREARWNEEVYHEKGLVLRQVAKRAAPLPPGASMNFLVAQRSSTHHAQEDSMKALSEVWERGLLRPGVADVSLLDWSTREPSHLAALAAALDGIAREGLLSVVWPILDDLIGASLKAPRLLSGTAELAELIESLLPEVQSAVEKGLADNAALDLPCIRLLAQISGSSRAVAAARKVSDLLPPVRHAPNKEEVFAAAMDTPFIEVWPSDRKRAVLIDDGVSMTVDWADPTVAAKQTLLFTLTLPGISDRVFQVLKGWTYDLETEGQCQAWPTAPGVAIFEREWKQSVWLRWDAKRKAIVACEHRDWVLGKDGPLTDKSVNASPLPLSFLTIIVGLLAQAEASVYYSPHLLKLLIENGQIDEKIIQRAMQTLLKYPAVSPAKLLRALEKDVKLLPVLWPMLTECIKAAGALTSTGEKPPVWINRVLDVALRYAPYLAESAKRGYIGADDASWVGLSDIASSMAKSAAIAKAKKLLALLG